jgi:hypothetical protein
MHLKNKSNDYVGAMGGDVFAAAPKTVLAAVAVSLATLGGDRLSDARELILREWHTLHQNGIVPQPVPPKLLNTLPPEDDEHSAEDLADDQPVLGPRDGPVIDARGRPCCYFCTENGAPVVLSTPCAACGRPDQ